MYLVIKSCQREDDHSLILETFSLEEAVAFVSDHRCCDIISAETGRFISYVLKEEA